MYAWENEVINYSLICGCFLGFSLLLMLKDAVIRVLTFVKDLDLS